MNTKTENTEKPLIGFEMRERDLTYRVYLINPGRVRYSKVVSLTGAFSGDDDGLLETSKAFSERGPLEPGSYLVLEESDWDGLDFVIWYELDLYREDDPTPERVVFTLPKYGGFQGEKGNTDDLPVLDLKGRKIALGLREDGESIEEKVKRIDMSGGYWQGGKKI